jgi:alpha-D-ribose 1-methylphosphonate 5-triphosphate synthase subunit PhnI
MYVAVKGGEKAIANAHACRKTDAGAMRPLLN